MKNSCRNVIGNPQGTPKPDDDIDMGHNSVKHSAYSKYILL